MNSAKSFGPEKMTFNGKGNIWNFSENIQQLQNRVWDCVVVITKLNSGQTVFGLIWGRFLFVDVDLDLISNQKSNWLVSEGETNIPTIDIYIENHP